MMTDPKFSITSTKDKYGRPIKKRKLNDDLAEYYYMDQPSEDENVSSEESEEDDLRQWM